MIIYTDQQKADHARGIIEHIAALNKEMKTNIHRAFNSPLVQWAIKRGDESAAHFYLADFYQSQQWRIAAARDWYRKFNDPDYYDTAAIRAAVVKIERDFDMGFAYDQYLIDRAFGKAI